MKHILRIFSVLAICLVFLPNRAQALGYNETAHVCGAYHFNVLRVVDGFQIRVSNGGKTRSLFYVDSFIDGGKKYSSVISGCIDDALAIIDRTSGKYDEGLTVNLIDPTQNALQIRKLASRNRNTAQPSPTVVTTPADASSTLDILLAQPTDPWDITRPGLVKKQRIASEASNWLNDQSYFVFDAHGGMMKKTTNSTWHTSIATDSIQCDRVSYVMYKKEFADMNTVTSTHPAEQYIIERTTPTSRAFIPIPRPDGDWRARPADPTPYFRECFGQNAALTIMNRMTMVTPKATFVDGFSPRTSIEPEFRNGTYYQGGSIWLDKDASGSVAVRGDATLRILHADGSITNRKPVFFRDIHQYEYPTSMEFRLDPTEKTAINVILTQVHPGNNTETAVFQEHGGSYQSIDRDPHMNWSDRDIFRFNLQPTPLYVSAENTKLALKSYFLTSSLLLHNLPNTKYTLLWNRVGPLEQDGTRKIWYSFRDKGMTQTWLATVR